MAHAMGVASRFPARSELKEYVFGFPSAYLYELSRHTQYTGLDESKPTQAVSLQVCPAPHLGTLVRIQQLLRFWKCQHPTLNCRWH